MNTALQTLLYLIVGALGGIAGGVFMQSGAPVPEQPARDAGADAEVAAALDDVTQRLLSLERSVDSQDVTISQLHNRIEEVASQSAPPPAEGEGLILDENGEPIAYSDGGRLPVGPGFDQAVSAVIDQKEAEERAEREARREERRQAMLQERVNGLADAIGLDAAQKEQVYDVLDDSYSARRELFANMRESGVWDRDQIRQEMTELREEQTGRLQEVMTPQQYAEYEKISGDGGGRGDWFGGVRRRGGDSDGDDGR